MVGEGGGDVIVYGGFATFMAWLLVTSVLMQGSVKVEICPIRTTDALASISGGRQLARGVGRAR